MPKSKNAQSSTSNHRSALESLDKLQIIQTYIEMVLKANNRMDSMAAFADAMDIGEQYLYEHFDSIHSIESEIWVYFIEDTLQALRSDEIYREYSVREKLLAFYFTHFQDLKKYRSYINVLYPKLNCVFPAKSVFKAYSRIYKDYIEELISEGLLSGEIVNRLFVTERYPLGFWLQLYFLLGFWQADKSKYFDKTDVAIEKSVALSMDLIIHGPLDSFIDFGKFLWQNRRGIV